MLYGPCLMSAGVQPVVQGADRHATHDKHRASAQLSRNCAVGHLAATHSALSERTVSEVLKDSSSRGQTRHRKAATKTSGLLSAASPEGG